MKEYKLNFENLIKRRMTRRTVELTHKWTKAKGINMEEFNSDNLKASSEKVENWSCKIYTVRYNSELVLRRFPEDTCGISYRFKVYY